MNSIRSSDTTALLVGLTVVVLAIAAAVAITSVGGQLVQLATFVGIGVVGLLAVFGGVYYWQSRQDTYDKLR